MFACHHFRMDASKTWRSNMQTAGLNSGSYRVYSSQFLHSIGKQCSSKSDSNNKCHLDIDILNKIHDLGICKSQGKMNNNRVLRKNFRKKRGGKRKQRSIKVWTTERYTGNIKGRSRTTHVNFNNLIKVKRSRENFNCGLKIACVNTRSVRNKQDDFVNHVVSEDLDICVVSETWLTLEDEVVLRNITPAGYDVRSSPREDRGGGGPALFFK